MRQKQSDEERKARQNRYYQEHKETIHKQRLERYQKNKEKAREYTKAWKARRKKEHPELWKAWRSAEKAKTKARNLQRIEEYKALNPCIICGESNPVVLVFHHRNENEKKDNISHLSKVSSSWRQIGIEIEKCVMLCANCHLIVHDQMRQCEAKGTQFSLETMIKQRQSGIVNPTLSLPVVACSTA